METTYEVSRSGVGRRKEGRSTVIEQKCSSLSYKEIIRRAN